MPRLRDLIPPMEVARRLVELEGRVLELERAAAPAAAEKPRPRKRAAAKTADSEK